MRDFLLLQVLADIFIFFVCFFEIRDSLFDRLILKIQKWMLLLKLKLFLLKYFTKNLHLKKFILSIYIKNYMKKFGRVSREKRVVCMLFML